MKDQILPCWYQSRVLWNANLSSMQLVIIAPIFKLFPDAPAHYYPMIAWRYGQIALIEEFVKIAPQQ